MTTLNGRSIDEFLKCDTFKKGLKDAECVIQYINKKYISLDDSDYTIYASHLIKVLAMLVQCMKRSNSLFNDLYQKEHFAGSYPDGLKIGKPTEYDMNLIIKLPVDSKNLKFELGNPSFVKINGKGIFAAASLPSEFMRWVDNDGYLLQSRFREWMESVLTKAFNTLPTEPSDPNTRLLIDETCGEPYKIKHKKSGPAMTLKVIAPDERILDVDLVPAFQFGEVWPASPVEALPKICKKKSWMVIPKPKKIKEGDVPHANDAREWRMSFLDQERELLSGSRTVKPIIKLLKKLRDTRVIKLSSYAIKTVVMFETKTQNPDFWKNRVTYLFLFMLNRLTECIRTGHIPFYWDHRDDLLKLDQRVYENVSNQLAKILKDIVKGIEQNPYIIAEKILTPEECQEVKENCQIVGLAKSRPSLAQAIGGSIVSDETDGGCGSGGGDGSNAVILHKILYKLDELNLGQKQIPGQVLQGICERNITLGSPHMEKSSHEKCEEKQAELESRIVELESTVQQMMRQIRTLTAGVF